MKLIDGEVKADPRLKGIEVGTVHAFQGGEADAVIFDIVDGPPRSRPGLLLRDDAGMRLVNVAVTRARGKLVMLAHLDWLHRVGRDAGLLSEILLGADRCDVVPPPPVEPQPQDIARPHQPQPESPIEQLLVDELTKRQASLPPVVLQHRIYNEQRRIVSRADIAFVDEKVAVYCDGAMYHLRPDQWQRDQRQRRELTRLGWHVLVFTGSEITADPSRRAEEIMRFFMGTSDEAEFNENRGAESVDPAADERLNSRPRQARRRTLLHAQTQQAADRPGFGETVSREVSQRFVLAMSGGAVVDGKSGLTWARSPLSREMTFAEARAAARDFNLGGHAWRLPTTQELFDVITLQQALSPAERPFPELPRWWFWSSEPDEHDSDFAWAVSAITLERRTCHVTVNRFCVILVCRT
jgi:very-short-patch-repair endonuclease